MPAPPRPGKWASQGTALQRRGHVHVERLGDEVWVGGDVTSVVEGTIDL